MEKMLVTKINVTENLKLDLGRVENIVGKKKKGENGNHGGYRGYEVNGILAAMGENH